MRVLLFVALALLFFVALASVYTDPGYIDDDDDYDAAVAKFVGELSYAADPPAVRDENYVRELLNVDQTLKMLKNSPHRKRYTVAFPIYEDSLHDLFADVAEEFADETTAQHILDDLQLRVGQAREAIALRK